MTNAAAGDLNVQSMRAAALAGDLKGARVLIREDLNVPVKDGVVTSDARIRAAVPTLKTALDAGCLLYTSDAADE